MISRRPQNPSLRAGIYSEAAAVDELLDHLDEADFAREEISILTSDEELQEHFSSRLDETFGKDKNNHRISSVGKAGLGLGSAAALAGLITASGSTIFVIGAFSGVFIAGTLVAFMMSRGIRKDTASFYDQELDAGSILVAVEVEDNDPNHRLEQVETIFQETGSKPVALHKD